MLAELIESLMYVYRASGDPVLLEMAVDMLEAIEHSSRTRCGYASVSQCFQCYRFYKYESRLTQYYLRKTERTICASEYQKLCPASKRIYQYPLVY